MFIQRSKTLVASTVCAITCMACSAADTRHGAEDALHEPPAAGDAALVSPARVGAPEPSAPESTSTAISAHEPPDVGASDETSDGAAPRRPDAVSMLNQLLTTQALLVSLLLTPVAKAPPPELPPVTSEPAPPAGSGSVTAPSSGARPSVQKLISSFARLHGAG